MIMLLTRLQTRTHFAFQKHCHHWEHMLRSQMNRTLAVSCFSPQTNLATSQQAHARMAVCVYTVCVCVCV